jgi:hypothetical protein
VNIHLHIERLILDGLPVGPGQGARVQAAVEGELARLLAGGGLAPGLQAGGALPGVSAPSIQLAPGSSPAQMGVQIAQSVYGGIGNIR